MKIKDKAFDKIPIFGSFEGGKKNRGKNQKSIRKSWDEKASGVCGRHCQLVSDLSSPADPQPLKIKTFPSILYN